MTLNTALGCLVCFVLLMGIGYLLAERYRQKRMRDMWRSHKEFVRRYREFQHS
jgi:preprotein translocase subunit YajC